MSEQPNADRPDGGEEPGEFARRAAERNSGLVRELIDLILTNKKWWLIPVIVALLLIGVIVLLGTTAAAPFIYPLF
jgi:hypothetical protein